MGRRNSIGWPDHCYPSAPGLEAASVAISVRLASSCHRIGLTSFTAAMLNLKVFLVKLIANFFFESVPTNLNDDSAVEVPARHPTQCYVRLTPTDTPSTGS